jgi:hypothetical protein
MPEQLTKHPEITLQVLRSAGAQCADNSPQSILTRCPAERFCKLPGGELCIYGLPEARQMTQVTPAEWRAVLQSLERTSGLPAGLGSEAVVGAGIGLVVGAAAVAVFRRGRGR